jgi:maleate isomerase
MVYGWRGIIGVMHPAPGLSMETEFHKIAPEGVAITTTRMPFPKSTPETLIALSDYVEEAADLLAQARPNLIVFFCTAGSFIKGIGYDYEIMNKIERRVGIPALTTSTAVIDSLRALNARKIVVATPYIEEVNQRERSFFEDSGFKVAGIKGLGLLRKMGYVEHEEIYRLVKDVYTEEAEAIFISCTGLCVVGLIEALEKEFKKPVVTSNQATFWAALRKLDIKEPIEGYGKLFLTA